MLTLIGFMTDLPTRMPHFQLGIDGPTPAASGSFSWRGEASRRPYDIVWQAPARPRTTTLMPGGSCLITTTLLLHHLTKDKTAVCLSQPLQPIPSFAPQIQHSQVEQSVSTHSLSHTSHVIPTTYKHTNARASYRQAFIPSRHTFPRLVSSHLHRHTKSQPT